MWHSQAIAFLIDEKEIVSQINKIQSRRSTQDNDILNRLWKENDDFYAEYIYIFFI